MIVEETKAKEKFESDQHRQNSERNGQRRSMMLDREKKQVMRSLAQGHLGARSRVAKGKGETMGLQRPDSPLRHPHMASWKSFEVNWMLQNVVRKVFMAGKRCGKL